MKEPEHINVTVAMVLGAALMAGVAARSAHAVGGDSCADPTTILALPYYDTGSTCLFQDDYDEFCGITAQGAPDVLYAYTPPVTQFIEVSLCDASDYDTRLWVYEGACGNTNNLVACNDDACTTSNLPSPFASNVRFAAYPSATYYIVVDGYAGACGNYTIEVLEGNPPECPPNTKFGQPPDTPIDSWVLGVSDVDFSPGFIRYDDFGDLAGAVCDVHWAGVMMTTSFQACFESPMPFTVTFYGDAGGQPGQSVCTYDVSLVGVPTGIYYWLPALEMYRWDLDLRDLGCCWIDSGWISIQGAGGDPGCLFWWVSSGSYTGNSLADDGQGIYIEDFDLALCLTGDFGACCLIDQCVEVVPEDCIAAGGVYLGDNSTCDLGCAPPPNDRCETATFLPVPADVVASNALADDDESPFCGTGSPYKGVWYVVEGTGGLLRATTCNAGSSFDTQIQVFCDCFEHVCVGGNDDETTGDPACDLHGHRLLSAVEWCSALGQLYFIKVGGFAVATGQLHLTVTEVGPCGPPVSCAPPIGRCCFTWCPWDCGDGDGQVAVVDLLALLAQWGGPGSCDFVGAGSVDVVSLLELLAHWGPCSQDPTCAETTPAQCEELGGAWLEGETCDVPCPTPTPGDICPECLVINDADLPYALVFDNSTAFNEGGPAGSCNTSAAVGMDNDVWLCYQPQSDCTLDLVVDAPLYDALVAVYTGPDCGSLVEIACLDDPEPMQLVIPVVAGQTYWFQVGDWGTFDGGGQTIFELDCAP